MKMFWGFKKYDYDNQLVFVVRFTRTRGAEELPTEGDLLDTLINYIAPKIRKGQMYEAREI